MPPPVDKYRLHGRVLVVDDVEENRTLMQYYLKRAGAEVVLTEDGVMALDGLMGPASKRTGPDAVAPFDLVLMDMQMPRVDGYTAVQQLRAAGFKTPIIAVTAHTLTGDREKCIRAGCDDYVPKPINPDMLLQKCQTLMARAAAA